MKKLLSFSLFLVTFVSGCGSGRKAILISLSTTTATVQAAGTMQFTATVANDSANKGVNWSVSCSAAQCGSVSPTTTPSGTPTTYTAPSTPPTSNLTVTITVTSVADSTKTSTITITIPAIAVAVAPATTTVLAGATAQFTATVTNDPATKGVTWSVMCSVAQCGSVAPTTTPSGTPATYSAPSTPPTSTLTVTITATSVSDTTKSNSATITVPAITVAVAPPSANVPVKGTQSFTATVSNDASNKGVTWALTQSGTSCSPGCGTITAATLSGSPATYTAPASVPANPAVTVTARSVADGTKSAMATATVVGITVSVAPTSASVGVSATKQFIATVTNDVSNSGVTWTLTQGGVACAATCGTVAPTTTASGTATTYTAPASVPANPTVTITAASVADPTKSNSATITVTAAPPISVSLAPPTATVAVNGTQPFTATVTNDSANAGVTWTLRQSGACSPTCGTVAPTSTASGTATTYTAPASVPTPATVTITATSVTDTTKSASATITVSATSNNSKLMGNYAFLFNGWHNGGLGGLLVVAGDFFADGNGNISNGLADLNGTNGSMLNQSFTGTYSIASDNLGTVTLTLGGGVTLAIAVQAGGDAKVIEFDDTTGTGDRGSGVFKKQDTTAFSTAKITGHYAFGSVGVDSTGKRFAVAGVFQADGAGNITNGLLDGDDGGALLSSATFTGTYSVAPSGRGTFTLTITGQGTSNFSFYVVSATEALDIQIDSVPAGKSLTSGSILQQTGGGSFTNASLSGTSVGESSSLKSGGQPGPSVAIMLATADGLGNVSFTGDHNNGGTLGTDSGTLTYSVASNGRVTLTGGTGGNPVVYLVSQNEGFLVGTTSFVDFGFVEHQSVGPFSNSSISGMYAGGSITPVDSNVSDEVDELVVTSAGNFSVTSDNSSGGGLTSNKMQSGTYSVAANGRTTATVTGQTGSVILYIVSPKKAVGFASDTNPKLVVFEQ